MSTKKKPRGWAPRPVPADLIRQIHLVSKDTDWNDKLDFICAVLSCKPADFVRDIVPIHYNHLIAGIRRDLDAQGVKHGLGELGTERVGDTRAEASTPEEGSAATSESQAEVVDERDS